MKIIAAILMLIFGLTISGCYTGIRTTGSNGPPPWAPAHGWRSHYNYYFPDYEIYYHVPTAQFIYFSGSNWIYVSTLPSTYSHINLWTCRKIVVSYYGKDPYIKIDNHRKNYPKANDVSKGKNENPKKSKGKIVVPEKKENIPKKTEKNKYEKSKGDTGGNKKQNNSKNGNGKGKGKK
jgi:hypothetical protein